jgi:hypothetical protein
MKKRICVILITLFTLVLVTLLFARQNQQNRQKQNCQVNFSAGENATVTGEIANVIFPMVTLKAGDKEYTVHLGPKWYWTQNKLELEQGKAEITGKISVVDGQTHIYPSVIKQGDNSIMLTDNAGKPQWLNNSGPQAGNQHGKSHCGKGNGCCKRQQCGGCRSKTN